MSFDVYFNRFRWLVKWMSECPRSEKLILCFSDNYDILRTIFKLILWLYCLKWACFTVQKQPVIATAWLQLNTCKVTSSTDFIKLWLDYKNWRSRPVMFFLTILFFSTTKTWATVIKINKTVILFCAMWWAFINVQWAHAEIYIQ